MACVGLEFIGRTIPDGPFRLVNKVKIYINDNGRWIQGELIKCGNRSFINGIEVRTETVGQLAHRRFNCIESDKVHLDFMKK